MRIRLFAVLAALLIVAGIMGTALADSSPFVGNSGNFSTASCPNPNNPHCPPQGK